MKGNYSGNTQNNPTLYSSSSSKLVSPMSQPRLSHTGGFTNTNWENGVRKEEYKDPKYGSTHSPHLNHTQKKYNRSPQGKSEASLKTIPSFIENKNGSMKGSMYVGGPQVEGFSKYSKHDPGTYPSINPEKPKRMPRMSEANYPEMRASNI